MENDGCMLCAGHALQSAKILCILSASDISLECLDQYNIPKCVGFVLSTFSIWFLHAIVIYPLFIYVSTLKGSIWKHVDLLLKVHQFSYLHIHYATNTV